MMEYCCCKQIKSWDWSLARESNKITNNAHCLLPILGWIPVGLALGKPQLGLGLWPRRKEGIRDTSRIGGKTGHMITPKQKILPSLDCPSPRSCPCACTASLSPGSLWNCLCTVRSCFSDPAYKVRLWLRLCDSMCVCFLGLLGMCVCIPVSLWRHSWVCAHMCACEGRRSR